MFLAEVALVVCLAPNSTPPLECVQSYAQQFARSLRLARPLTIRILTTYPKKNANQGVENRQWAWTRRSHDEYGCDIDFMVDGARDLETIAHEVCHCRYHYRYMTVGGEARIPRDVGLWRVEEEAGRCATQLLEGMR